MRSRRFRHDECHHLVGYLDGPRRLHAGDPSLDELVGDLCGVGRQHVALVRGVTVRAEPQPKMQQSGLVSGSSTSNCGIVHRGDSCREPGVTPIGLFDRRVLPTPRVQGARRVSSLLMKM